MNCLIGNISHPTSLSRLLSLICSLPQCSFCWILSASLLTLSSPSVVWARRGSAHLQLHWRRVCRIPRLHSIMAVAWVPLGSSKSLLSPHWLLPPSDPPWFLLYCLPTFLPALCHPLSPSLLHSSLLVSSS